LHSEFGDHCRRAIKGLPVALSKPQGPQEQCHLRRHQHPDRRAFRKVEAGKEVGAKNIRTVKKARYSIRKVDEKDRRSHSDQNQRSEGGRQDEGAEQGYPDCTANQKLEIHYDRQHVRLLSGMPRTTREADIVEKQACTAVGCTIDQVRAKACSSRGYATHAT
jgi:hypothetical protein